MPTHPRREGRPGTRSLARRDRLILEHLRLVEHTAWGIAQDVGSAFDVKDLISLGHLGLIQAAGRYRPEQFGRVPFAIYAKKRIRGAILDGIRRKNWVESQHESLNSLLEAQERRQTHDGALRGPLEASPLQESSAEVPIEAIDARRVSGRLRKGYLRRLSPLQTGIMSLYYSDASPTFAQIAARLQVSAEMVSREHAAALKELRIQFGVR